MNFLRFFFCGYLAHPGAIMLWAYYCSVKRACHPWSQRFLFPRYISLLWRLIGICFWKICSIWAFNGAVGIGKAGNSYDWRSAAGIKSEADLELEVDECICSEITFSKKEWAIFSIYRPPNAENLNRLFRRNDYIANKSDIKLWEHYFYGRL